MVNSKETVLELERILEAINTNLKKVLPAIEENPAADPNTLKILKETEILSRWKRTPLPGDQAGYDYAIARAQIKAKEHGESFVVLEKDAGQTVVVVSKSRLLKEKPFGLTEKSIIFETGKALA